MYDTVNDIIVCRGWTTGSASSVSQIAENEGETVVLTCDSENSVEWRHDGLDGKIFTKGRFTAEKSLRIANATVDDSGLYRCNDADTGDLIMQFNVTVHRGNSWHQLDVHILWVIAVDVVSGNDKKKKTFDSYSGYPDQAFWLFFELFYFHWLLISLSYVHSHNSENNNY